VALVAGVSQSAVSRCFKPGASVSKDHVCGRVMKAAALLDYTECRRAQPDYAPYQYGGADHHQSANLYYPELLAELSQQLTPQRQARAAVPAGQRIRGDRVLADVWQYQVDGVIAAARLPATTSPNSAPPHAAGAVQPPAARPRACTPSPATTARRAACWPRLAAAGHRQFGIIAGSKDSASPSRAAGVANNGRAGSATATGGAGRITITAAAQQA
jgi:DNA-binding LacI/PurR family transcriptional regulator